MKPQGKRVSLMDIIFGGDLFMKFWVVVILFVLAFGAVGQTDYKVAVAAENKAMAARLSAAEDALRACLNGGVPGYYFDNERGEREYVVCRGADTINIGKPATWGGRL